MHVAAMRNHKGWVCVFSGWFILLLSLFCVYFPAFPSIADAAEPAKSGISDLSARRPSVGHEEAEWPAVKNMVEEGTFLLERDEQEVRKGREAAVRPSSAFSNVVTMALATALLTMVFLIARDVMNFVGDVPDPFENISAAEAMPAALQKLIDSDTPVAFVVRRCKYCGMGIKAMRKAGMEPVVVMVEGHRFKRQISDFLKSNYTVQGFPYFFVDRKHHGYLSQLKEFLQ